LSNSCPKRPPSSWRADLISTVAVLLVEEFRETLPVPVTFPGRMANDTDWAEHGHDESWRFLLRPDQPAGATLPVKPAAGQGLSPFPGPRIVEFFVVCDFNGRIASDARSRSRTTPPSFG
jgi:hypothetical protein